MTAEPQNTLLSEAPEDRAHNEVQLWARKKTAKIGDRLAALNDLYQKQCELLALPETSLVAGYERWYSAAETSRFFNRTSAWIYDRLAKGKFKYEDGTPIKPRLEGDGPKPRMRFNPEIIREMALSCYRSGTVKWLELQVIMRRIAESELEGTIYDPDMEDDD